MMNDKREKDLIYNESWNQGIFFKRPGLLTKKTGDLCAACTTWAPILQHCIPLPNATTKEVAMYTEWYLSSDVKDYTPD